MSFLLDPPLLFISGVVLFFIGKRFMLERLTKITIGLLIVTCFFLFSLLLYANIFSCSFPVVCNCSDPDSPYQNYHNNSTEFMLHTYGPLIETGIKPESVPTLAVLFLFAIYPLWIYFGYASAILLSKRRIKVSKEIKKFGDVKSRRKAAETSRCSVVRYPDNNINSLKEALKKAVEDIRDPDKDQGKDGLKSFINPGERVLVKVNICGGVPDNNATYTSRELVEDVLELVKDAGGKPVVCDADMIWTKFWDNAKPMGYTKDWAIQNEVELKNLSETDLVTFKFDAPEMIEEIVSREMIDADVIISIPKMKTHLLTGVTLGMKNMYGTFPDIDKAKYHEIGINEVIYWINYAFRPTLTIIDGTIGGEEVGPLSCRPVDNFNTIVASNNVALADSVASKLMGFDNPFSDIEHLKIAKERGFISKVDPEELNEKLNGSVSVKDFLDYLKLPALHNKDGNWTRPDKEAVNFYNNLLENVIQIPSWKTLFNIGADFFLFDAARIPFLKYINIALLQFLYDLPRFWVKSGEDTPKSRGRKQTNLIIFSLIALISIFFFSKYYLYEIQLKNSFSLLAVLGLIFVLVFGALIARRMRTKHLLAIIVTSIVLGFFWESTAVLAGWWSYLEGANCTINIFRHDIYICIFGRRPPLFPIFALPGFITVVAGLSYILKNAFAYVGLKGERFKLVPYAVIFPSLFVLMFLENFVAYQMIMIYLTFVLLGLYINNRNTLEWNISLAIVSISMGSLMELLGFLGGLWGYPNTPGHMPIFLCLAWAVNVWAICGASQIFGIDLADPFD